MAVGSRGSTVSGSRGRNMKFREGRSTPSDGDGVGDGVPPGGRVDGGTAGRF